MRSLCFTILCVGLLAAPVFATCPPVEPVANDTCGTAIPLGTDPLLVEISGNTAGALNDYNVGHDNDCTGSRSDGPDIVFSITVSPSCIVTATLDICESWYEQSVYIVTDCADLMSNCVGSDGTCVDGVCPTEQAIWENATGSPQSLYIVLDGRTPSAGGAFNLTVATDCVVPVESSTWGAIKATYN